MKRRIIVTLAAALAIGALATGMRADEPSKKDLEAMQGTWTIESFTLDGNEIDRDELKNWRRVVKDKHVVWTRGEEVLVELDITFDPSKKPMTLDSKATTGDAKGQTALAIYELKDDELRVCFANPGKPRPTDFSSIANTGQSLFTAKRVKKKTADR